MAIVFEQTHNKRTVCSPLNFLFSFRKLIFCYWQSDGVTNLFSEILCLVSLQWRCSFFLHFEVFHKSYVPGNSDELLEEHQ